MVKVNDRHIIENPKFRSVQLRISIVFHSFQYLSGLHIILNSTQNQRTVYHSIYKMPMESLLVSMEF